MLEKLYYEGPAFTEEKTKAISLLLSFNILLEYTTIRNFCKKFSMLFCYVHWSFFN